MIWLVLLLHQDDEIGRIIIKHPAIFGTSLSKFDRNIQFLRDGGIKEVAKAINKLPQVLLSIYIVPFILCSFHSRLGLIGRRVMIRTQSSAMK